MPGHVRCAPSQQHPALGHQVWHPLKVHLLCMEVSGKGGHACED